MGLILKRLLLIAEEHIQIREHGKSPILAEIEF
jgi:hypothetical protein